MFSQQWYWETFLFRQRNGDGHSCVRMCVSCRAIQDGEQHSEGQAFLIHLWGRQHKSQPSILMTYDSTQNNLTHMHRHRAESHQVHMSHKQCYMEHGRAHNRKQHNDLMWQTATWRHTWPHFWQRNKIEQSLLSLFGWKQWNGAALRYHSNIPGISGSHQHK